MINISRWLSIMWLTASIGFAQAPVAPGEPDVKVVFAPQHRQEAAHLPGKTATFAAPGGAVGIRLGDEFAVGIIVTAGSNGKLQFRCGRLDEEAKKAKAVNSVTQPERKGAAHEK